MKEKRKEFLVILIFLLVILAVLLRAFNDSSYKVGLSQKNKTTLTRSERQFVKEKRTVRVAVDKDLTYFASGFLEDYMESILQPVDLKVEVLQDQEKRADAVLAAVDEEARSQVDHIQFTAALFQIKGSLFIRKGLKTDKETFQGLCVKGQFTDTDKKRLSYGGKPVRLRDTRTIEEAVKRIGEEKLDCIAGDQDAILNLLKAEGLQDAYENTHAELYKRNVCLIMEEKDATLYSVLNQCIHNGNLQVLMGQAQERWFGTSGQLVEAGKYKDAASLLAIVFAAVFCTFFFYYQSNKNLYNELTARMNQLTASKQEMQTTFNGVSYYMAELDPDGIILDINKAFLNYVNRESMGRPIWEVLELPEDLRGALQDMMEKTKATQAGTSKELTLQRIILEINLFPILSPKGEAEKLLFMASNVTGERMAERQMLQDNKMIAVGQLAAGVAHEIRNPLGIIRNYCYVLKNMKDESLQEQAVQIIEKSVDTAGDIIDNLLNFSRISNKRIETVRIKEHVDSVIALNRGMLKKKQIEVQVGCEEDFPVRMAVESFDMVFINLVSNAIDAMERQGTLSVDIGREGEEFSIEVTDTGTGIEEDILNDIFNPFFTTKSSTEGNGLGLYIVYNELQKMNGKIQVRSRVGKGTTFKVTLPVRREEEQSE